MRGILIIGFVGVVLLAWAMFSIKADTAQQSEVLASLDEEKDQLERDVNTLTAEASHLAGAARAPGFAEEALGLVPVAADQRVAPGALPELLKDEAATTTGDVSQIISSSTNQSTDDQSGGER
jgi:cell division protein FtsL